MIGTKRDDGIGCKRGGGGEGGGGLGGGLVAKIGGQFLAERGDVRGT